MPGISPFLLQVDQYQGSRELDDLVDYVKRQMEKKNENAEVNEGKVPDQKPKDEEDDEPVVGTACYCEMKEGILGNSIVLP